MNYLTTRQISRLIPYENRGGNLKRIVVRTRMRELYKMGLIQQPHQPSKYDEYIHRLSQKGINYLKENFEHLRESDIKLCTKVNKNIYHSLDISEFYCNLHEEVQGKYYIKKFHIDKPFERYKYRPDIFVELRDIETDKYIGCFFVEVDRGTEEYTTLIEKAYGYERLFKSGFFQHKIGYFPTVHWLMNNKVRVKRFQKELQKEFAKNLEQNGEDGLTEPVNHKIGLSELVYVDIMKFLQL